MGTQKNDVNAMEIGDDKVAFAQSGDTRIDTALINAYFDIPLAGGFSMYAGGGAGAAIVTVNLNGTKNKFNNEKKLIKFLNI